MIGVVLVYSLSVEIARHFYLILTANNYKNPHPTQPLPPSRKRNKMSNTETFTKYLGTLKCSKVDEMRSYQELERKGIVQLTPIITEDAVMVFAKRGSKLKAFNRISQPNSKATEALNNKEKK